MRTPMEFREVHLEVARNSPLDSLDPTAVMKARTGSPQEPLYIVCRSGSRGRQACEKFLAAGFTNIFNVDGGTLACIEAGLPVIRGKKAVSLERIDILAVAIQAGMTVFDLEEMELAYSPQYGSAKDPINMAGFVAAGLIRGEHPQIDVESAVVASRNERLTLVDVRTSQEYAGGHIPGAMNIPADELRSRLGELPRDREIGVYCQVGQRGYLATRILAQIGFKVVNIGGGYKTYKLVYPSV